MAYENWKNTNLIVYIFILLPTTQHLQEMKQNRSLYLAWNRLNISLPNAHKTLHFFETTNQR